MEQLTVNTQPPIPTADMHRAPSAPKRFRRLVFRILALSVAGIAAFGVTEVLLRSVRDTDQFYPHFPNTVRQFYPTAETTPGVIGISRVTINSHGTRGPELAGQPTRILTVGGSTTACIIVDDTETWPSLLMDNLNDAASNENAVWVTNSGICGLHSEHHLMHARYLLPPLPRIDYMIVYAGINDVGYWLNDTDFDPAHLSEPANWNGRIGESFRGCSFTSRTDPWFKHLELWKLGSKAKAKINTWTLPAGSENEDGAVIQDARLEWLEAKRLKRQAKQKVKIPAEKMATLPAALDSYAANLQNIIDSAWKHGTEPILMAQAMPGHTLSPEEQKRQWMGTMDGGQTYIYHSERLAVLAKYNDRMRTVAKRNNVLFLDLPSHMQNVDDAFYDDCHFNEHGCRETAKFVAEQLRHPIADDRLTRLRPDRDLVSKPEFKRIMQ